MITKNLSGRYEHYCSACSIYQACENGGELLEQRENYAIIPWQEMRMK